MPVYSHSRLSTFERCPYKFKLCYIDGIKREEAETIEAFVGSRVHEVLKKLYDDLRVTKVNTVGELFNYYQKLWHENWSDSITIVRRNYSKDHYYQLGKKCIQDYYDKYAPFNQATTIGTELAVNFDLDTEGKYKMTGFIDRLAHFDGTYEVHDYKTSAYLPSQEELDKDRQLALYQLAIEQKWPNVQKVNLIWHYLAFNLEMISQREREKLENLRKETILLIDKIEHTQEFPAIESNLCDWCEYPDLCPKRRHFYIVENLPENGYFKDKGVNLVNRYVELSTLKTEVEKKITQVKEQLVAYAKQENLEVIKGSDHKIRIKIYQRLKFPAKDTLERAALEDLIKKEGKWIEVSDLSQSALAKVVQNKKWEEQLLQKILGFSTEEESPWVSSPTKLEEYGD